MDKSLQLIKDLTSLHGVSGFEEEVKFSSKKGWKKITEII